MSTTSPINASAVATCPKGTRLVGGGFASGLVIHGKYENDLCVRVNDLC